MSNLLTNSPRASTGPGGDAPRSAGARTGIGPFRAGPLLLGAASALILLAIVIGWALFRAGSIGGGMAYLAGRKIYAGPADIAIPGDGQASQTISLVNLTGTTLTVMGYNATCSCVKVSGLPVRLPPYGKGQVEMRAHSMASVEVPVNFITDRTGNGGAQVVARVTAPTSP